MFNATASPAVELEAFTYNNGWAVLPDLTSCLNDCGGWIQERRAVSARTMEFRLELRLESILELYGSLMGSGIELTCKAHAILTGLCTCRRNAEHLITMGGTVMLRLVLHAREQITVPILLATGSAAA